MSFYYHFFEMICRVLVLEFHLRDREMLRKKMVWTCQSSSINDVLVLVVKSMMIVIVINRMT